MAEHEKRTEGPQSSAVEKVRKNKEGGISPALFASWSLLSDR
jgi:hypothetical protein